MSDPIGTAQRCAGVSEDPRVEVDFVDQHVVRGDAEFGAVVVVGSVAGYNGVDHHPTNVRGDEEGEDGEFGVVG